MTRTAAERGQESGEERAPAPLVELQALDELWFQVGGTLCNLRCSHCFISCHPGNDTFGFLGLETVKRYLDEAEEQGVKEYYFTGGEPFLNREILPILEEALRRGPTTVLTNGIAFRAGTAERLQALAEASRYSLEIRISIDGCDSAQNDPIRGEGTFEGAMAGVVSLVAAGFLPIITMAQTWPDEETPEVFGRFVETLRKRGYARPRIKILPTLRLGMEEDRSRPYLAEERVTASMLDGFDQSRLLCSHSRTVTDRGVAVCPILIEAAGAHLGSTLAEAKRPFAIDRGACYTCYQYGSICSNATSSLRPGER